MYVHQTPFHSTVTDLKMENAKVYLPDRCKYECEHCWWPMWEGGMQVSCGHWLCDRCARYLVTLPTPRCPNRDCSKLLLQRSGALLRYNPRRDCTRSLRTGVDESCQVSKNPIIVKYEYRVKDLLERLGEHEVDLAYYQERRQYLHDVLSEVYEKEGNEAIIAFARDDLQKLQQSILKEKAAIATLHEQILQIQCCMASCSSER